MPGGVWCLMSTCGDFRYLHLFSGNEECLGLCIESGAVACHSGWSLEPCQLLGSEWSGELPSGG